MTLKDFLLARIAEDEFAAARVTDGQWAVADWDSRDIERHASRWEPGRVLDECKAKRRIVGLWDLRMSEGWNGSPPEPLGGEAAEVFYDTLRALALPYASHAEYDITWGVSADAVG